MEPAHRAVKRVPRPMVGCKVGEAAQDTLVGGELMHRLTKKPLGVEAEEESLPAAALCYSLAASSPHRQRQLPHDSSLRKRCDRAVVRPRVPCYAGVPRQCCP